MFLQEITSKYRTARIPRCDEGCKLRIENRNHIILKGELLVRDRPEKICDCIVFKGDKTVGVVELKSRSLDANKIIAKFDNSGQKLASMIKPFGHIGDFKLYFILLTKSYRDYPATYRLRRAKIKIQGKKYSIYFGRCGCSLEKIIR